MDKFGKNNTSCNRNTVESYRNINIAKIHKWGYTNSGNWGMLSWSRMDKEISRIAIIGGKQSIKLFYEYINSDDSRDKMNYKIKLSWSTCNFGGYRPWFMCPACNRRVAILYGSKYFICRHCLELRYPSTLERDEDRASRQANKIRDKLNWEPGILNPDYGKPKGMHDITYQRLLTKYERYTRRAFKGMMRYIGIATTHFD